jgi:hypothetical protein
MAEVPEFPREYEEKFFPGGFTLRDEANAIVAWAFRNGPLEDLHAGQFSELLQDKKYSRITDEEMKQLMLYACEQVELLLRLKQDNPREYDLQIKSYAFRNCRRWDR